MKLGKIKTNVIIQSQSICRQTVFIAVAGCFFCGHNFFLSLSRKFFLDSFLHPSSACCPSLGPVLFLRDSAPLSQPPWNPSAGESPPNSEIYNPVFSLQFLICFSRLVPILALVFGTTCLNPVNQCSAYKQIRLGTLVCATKPVQESASASLLPLVVCQLVSCCP